MPSSDKPAHPISPPTKRFIPWWRKVIYAFIPLVLFWGMAEGLLALVGVRPENLDEDPFVGFSKSSPLMMEINASTGPRMVTKPNKLIWFNRQLFDKKKTPQTKRIFCVGGSTTFGRPYADSTSFCGWMREILPLVDSETDWQVINAGGVSYASYRVTAVMEELATYEPDLFVVYCGHNEFLEERTYAGMRDTSQTWMQIQEAASNLRTYAFVRKWLAGLQVETTRDQREILPVDVDERLNKTIGPVDYHRDPEWATKVVKHYEFNLRRMVNIAHNAGAAIVFVMPASNELDSDPFKAEPGKLTQEAFERWATRFALADEALEAGKLQVALKHLQAAKRIDPQDAATRYRLGTCLFDLQRFSEAQLELAAAIDEDVCPLRATSAVKDSLRNVARSLRVPLVDYEELMREKSEREFGHRLLGNQYFLDHVHPNIYMHRELALWILESLSDSGFIRNFDYQNAGFREQLAECVEKVESGIDQEQNGVALRNLAKVMHWAGKFEIASARASDALEMIRNDAESRFVLADCLKNLGRPMEALTQYEFLYQDHPDYWRSYLPHGELLMNLGQLEEAADMLAAALVSGPDNPYLHLTIGRLLMEQRQWEKAIHSLNLAAELYGSDVQDIEQLIQDCRTQMASAVEAEASAN